MTTSVRSTWHVDVQSGSITRYPKPSIAFPTTAYRILNLPEPLLREQIAVHEAGHAALALHLGIRFTSVSVADDLGHGPDTPSASGSVECTGDLTAPPCDVMLFAAAGERAADRWLRDTELWTPARAWVVEILADADRAVIDDVVRLLHPGGLTCGVSDDPSRDLAAIHDQADALLDRLWEQVGRVADALNERGRLTEEQAAEAAGLSPKAGWRR